MLSRRLETNTGSVLCSEKQSDFSFFCHFQTHVVKFWTRGVRFCLMQDAICLDLKLDFRLTERMSLLHQRDLLIKNS